MKMAVCALTQLLGMSYFLATQINHEVFRDGVCNSSSLSIDSAELMLKLLAMLFALWISMILVDQLVDIDMYGLYSFGSTQPPFTSNCIVLFGLVANFAVIVMCWVTSLCLMVQSADIAELILLDAEMVFGHDYHEIEVYFSTAYDEWLRRYIDGVNERKEPRMHDVCSGDCCRGQLIKDPDKCWLLLLPFIVAGPMFVGVCY